MARVLITRILALLLLQLAAGQSPACQIALDTLASNIPNCISTPENPLIICSEECRGYFDDVINNCDAIVS